MKVEEAQILFQSRARKFCPETGCPDYVQKYLTLLGAQRPFALCYFCCGRKDERKIRRTARHMHMGHPALLKEENASMLRYSGQKPGILLRVTKRFGPVSSSRFKRSHVFAQVTRCLHTQNE